MNIRFHSFRLSRYDYVWLGLLSLIGVACIATALLGSMTGADLFDISSEDFNALYSSIFMVGLMSLGIVSIILFLIKDRRQPGSDRRKSIQAINFPDRRSGIVRRSAAPKTFLK